MKLSLPMNDFTMTARGDVTLKSTLFQKEKLSEPKSIGAEISKNRRYMKTVISKDGTRIAYDVYGEGQPIIMVGGTMNSRVFASAPGAELLGKYFAVYDYDRRGRGDSEESYDPDEEIECCSTR
jgi:hypothetical protein